MAVGLILTTTMMDVERYVLVELEKSPCNDEQSYRNVDLMVEVD